MMQSPSLLVPSNILLFGEYAVLEPGGLALSIATEPYVSAWAKPDDVLGCTAIMDTTHYSTAEDNELLNALCTVFSQAGIALAPLNLTVDSSALFTSARALNKGAPRHKLGMGSSAAATVAMTALLLHAAGIEPMQHTSVLQFLAVRAHRLAKGGSGYDVVTSINGNCSLIIGGGQPHIYRQALPFSKISMISTDSVTDSSGAVRAYRQWKLHNPRKAKGFLQRSNALVLSLIQGRDRGLQSHNARRSSTQLSQDIGLGLNELAVQEKYAHALSSAASGWKFSGAGDELLLLFDASEGSPLVLAGGIRWE